MELSGISQAIIQGLAFGGVFALISGGMTLFHNVTNHVNVAVGSLMILDMYIMLILQQALGLDAYIVALIALPILVLFALFMWYVTLKRCLHYDHLMLFQLFVAWILVIEFFCVIIWGSDFRVMQSFIALSKVHMGPLVMRTTQLIAFLVSMGVIGALYWMITKTEFGCTIRATAYKPDIARLMGINVDRLQLIIFVLSIIMVGVAAGVLAPYFTFSPYSGLTLALFSLIILVMGGFGSWEGTLVASLIIGLVYGISSFYIPNAMAILVPYFLFYLVLVFRPQGLFGVR